MERKLYDDATCTKTNDKMNPTFNLPCALEVSTSQTNANDHLLKREGEEESFSRSGHSLPTSNCSENSSTFIGLHNEYWREIHRFIASANFNSTM